MLPKDPVILLSYINTLLRDKYASLDMLCQEENVEMDALCQSLQVINYTYNKEFNQFL